MWIIPIILWAMLGMADICLFMAAYYHGKAMGIREVMEDNQW